MRRVPILAWFLILLLLNPIAALAGEMTAPTTWEGYLFKDEQGRLRIGYPVYGSVMEGAVLEVGGKLREKLEPFASGAKEEFFWWTWWLGEGKPGDKLADISAVPKILVRIWGNTEEAESDTRAMPDGTFMQSDSNARYVMSEGRVLHVEFLTDEWLVLWRRMSGLMDRKTGRPKSGTDPVALLNLLLEMEKAGAVTDQMREKMSAVDARAKVVRYHQKNETESAVKWVRDLHGSGIAGLEAAKALPDFPEGGYRVSNIFMDSGSRRDFIMAVRAKWEGDLGELLVGYWVQTQNRGWASQSRVDEVEELWTDDEFLQLQASTRKQRGK